MPGMKECRTCSEIKELDCFYFRKDSGKHRGECKACTVVVSMRRHVANKGDPAIEAQKREYRKSYYKKHKDGKIRAWREENREDQGKSKEKESGLQFNNGILRIALG